MRSNVRIALWLAAAALAVGAGGCSGEKKVDVTGRVTYNGSPLCKPGGEIVFVDPRGNQVVASIGPDGTYRAVGVLAGPNRVAVYYPNPEIKHAKRLPPEPKKGEAPRPPAHPHVPPFLTPYKYASVDTSNLSVHVESGAVFNADMLGPKVP